MHIGLISFLKNDALLSADNSRQPSRAVENGSRSARRCMAAGRHHLHSDGVNRVMWRDAQLHTVLIANDETFETA